MGKEACGEAQPAAETEETANPPVDVRDRIDNPSALPPAEKPKPKNSIWNLFGR